MKANLKKLTNFTFGSSSAIITNVSLIVGLGASDVPKMGIIGSLMIIAVADNISDSLGIHIYRESESGGLKESAISTVSNFLARLLTSLTFIGLVWYLPFAQAEVISIIWGVLLLGTISYLIARKNNDRPLLEILKHLATAMVVIAAARFVGGLIHNRFLR